MMNLKKVANGWQQNDKYRVQSLGSGIYGIYERSPDGSFIFDFKVGGRSYKDALNNYLGQVLHAQDEVE